MHTTRFVAAIALVLLCILCIATAAVHAGSTQTCQMKNTNVKCYDTQIAGRGRGGARTLSAPVQGRRRRFRPQPWYWKQQHSQFAGRVRRSAAAFQPAPVFRGRRFGRAPAPRAGGGGGGRRRRRRRRGFGRRFGRAFRRLGRGLKRLARNIGRALGRLFRRKKKRPVCINPQTMQPVLCGQPVEVSCTYSCEEKFANAEVCTCPEDRLAKVTLNFFQVARPSTAPKSCPIGAELGVIPLSDARQIVKGVAALCTQKNCYCDENGIGLSKLSSAVKSEIKKSGLEEPPEPQPGQQRRQE